jgi:hypothetical protein
MIERLKASFEMYMGDRIRVCREMLIEQRVEGIQCLRCVHTLQTVLMDDMAGNGEEISFRAANLLEALDAQESQEHLLGEICRISGVSETRREKAAQSLAVFHRDVGDEVLVSLRKQVSSVEGLCPVIRATNTKNRLLYMYPGVAVGNRSTHRAV